MVFTGTPALLNSFRRLALEPLALAPADPDAGELAGILAEERMA